MHLGQLGDDPSLKLVTDLDQQLLDGVRQLVARLDQVFERLRLIFRRGLRRGPVQVLLGGSHRTGGADQILLKRDAAIAQPGRDLGQDVGRAPVPGLVLLKTLELGRIDGLAGRRDPFVQSVKLLLEEILGPPGRGQRPVRIVGRQDLDRITQVRIGLLEERGIKVLEERVAGKLSGRLAEPLSSFAAGFTHLPGGLVGAGRDRPAHLGDPGAMVADQPFEARQLGLEVLELPLLLNGRARPRQLAAFLLDDPIELRERLAHLPEPRQLHLEVEVFGQEQAAQVFQLRQQLPGLGLRLGQLRVDEELLRLLHLEQDQLLAREIQGQLQPRGILRLEARVAPRRAGTSDPPTRPSGRPRFPG